MNKLNHYLLTFLAIFATILQPTYASAENEKSSTDSIKGSNPFDGWSEERFAAYEDSLLRALYPEVRECHYPDSLLRDSHAEISPASVITGYTSSISNPILPDVAQIDKTNTVGEIEIKSGMTQTGAKTYEVPIKAYPGMNGFQPQISLAYNSQSGNSVVGLGWALSGIPIITRGGKNPFHDNKREGILMDNSDSFYIDGIRLIKTDSSSSGSITYESEQGNIKATGYISGTVMKYFKVSYPDGSTARFGYTSNSENTLYYPITSVSDIHGNIATYVYSLEDNYYFISKIEYNGASLKFAYRERTDPITTYISGKYTAIRKHLASITCLHGELTMGEYTLNLSLHNDVSHLSSIEYSSGQDQFNPIRFIYGNGRTEERYKVDTTQLIEWYESDDKKMIKVVKGRFNYGNTDDGLIVLPNKNTCWHKYQSRAAFRKETNRLENKYLDDEKIFLYTGLSESFASPMPSLVTGTGFVDIFCANLRGGQEEFVVKVNNYQHMHLDRLSFTVLRSNLHTGLQRLYTRTYDFGTLHVDEHNVGSVQPKFFYSGDFNGDGKMEVLAVCMHNPCNDTSIPTRCYLFDLENDRILYNGREFDFKLLLMGTNVTDEHHAANNSDKLMAFDVDSDGKTDICLINESGCHTYTFDISGDGSMNLRLLASKNLPNRSQLADRDIFTGEFNSDGFVDFAVSPKRGTSGNTNNWTIYCSSGDGKFINSTSMGPGKPTDNGSGFVTQDIDSDGRTDIIKYDSSGFDTFASASGRPWTTSIRTQFAYANSILVPTDINSRNPFSQLLCLHKGKVTKYSFIKDKSREQLLTGMISSLGLIEKNDYRSLCDSHLEGGNYTHSSKNAFPYVSIREPMMVLARTESLIDGKLCSESTYAYENAVLHRMGLGFRGFEKVTSFDSHGDMTVSTYDPYNHSVPVSVVSPSFETYTNYSVDIKPGGKKIILLDTKTEKDLLTGYIADFSYTYDRYGFPLTETATYSDGIKILKETTYGTNADESDIYSVGVATDVKVTTTRGDDRYVERLLFAEHRHRQPIAAVKYINGNQVERTEYSYDSHGNVTGKTVKPYESTNGLTYAYTYTQDGLLSEETDPWGCSRTYTYDAYGRVSAIQDYTGTTSISYDPFGREISRSFPDNTQRITTYEWTKAGSPGICTISTERTGEPTISESLDALGRTVRNCDTRFDGKIRKIDRTYDIHGNLARETLPFRGSTASQWTNYEYDTHNRLLTISEPSGRHTHYSYDGAAVTTTEDNVPIRRTYDSQGHLLTSTDAGGGVLSYDRAADGQPATIQAPLGLTTWIYYDRYRRLSCLGDAAAGSINSYYDEWGNLSRRSSDGKEIKYEYDGLNRLKKIITPELITTYTYDSNNRLTSVSSDNGTSQTITYDNCGRVATRLEVGVNGIWMRRDYSYADGNVNSIEYTTWTGLELTEEYTYANGTFVEGKVNGISVYRLDAEDTSGNPEQIQTQSITQKYSWSSGGLPERRTAYIEKSHNIQDYSYDFDPSTSNLTRREDLVNGQSEGLAYDNLNRLVSTDTQEFSYNYWGNITDRSDVGAFGYNYYYKPHAITDITPYRDSMPARTQEISYTSFSRPDSISENRVKAYFTYNGLSDRVRMHVTRGNVQLLDRHYLGGCYECDVWDSSPFEKLYLFGDYYDAPAIYATERDYNVTCNILRDYLGSITHLIDSNGYVLQEMSYDAWGGLRNPLTLEKFDKSPNGDPELLLGRGYTGHEHLPWFGLINMNARLYDPLTGRFLSPDPYIQMPDYLQSFNRFSYALNNPFKYVDRDGEFLWLAVAAFVGATINVAVHWNDVSSASGWNMVGRLAGYAFTGAVAGGVSAAVGVAVAGALGGTMMGVAAGTTGFINGAITGASMGASSGFILGTGNSLMYGNDFGDSLLDGLKEGAIDGLAGGVTGGVSGGVKALNQSRNFWTGKYSTRMLVQRSATNAELHLGGKGHAAGSRKHKYATDVLKRYQSMVEERHLTFGDSKKLDGKKLILDVLDNKNHVIYDWKFGYPDKTPFMLNQSIQMQKYRKAWGYPTIIIKP